MREIILFSRDFCCLFVFSFLDSGQNVKSDTAVTGEYIECQRDYTGFYVIIGWPFELLMCQMSVVSVI